MTNHPTPSLNDSLQEVTVSALSEKGEGIAYTNDAQLYIPYTLVGDKVQVEVGEPFAQGSKRRPGKVVQFLYKVDEHCEQELCPHFKLCGGCQLQHIKYEEQLKLKENMIDEALAKVKATLEKANNNQTDKNIDLGKRLAIVASSQEDCRFKSIRYFAQKEQHLVSGFYKIRSHEIVEVAHCPLEPALFGTIANQLTVFLEQNQILAYQEESQENKTDGSLQARALMMRLGDQDELLVNLVLTAKPDPSLVQKLADFAQQHKISSFMVSVNNREGNALFSDELLAIYGNDYINKTILEHQFKVRANTFLQVNYEICQQIYKKAISYAYGGLEAVNKLENNEPIEIKRQHTALDLCCGVGTMSLALSKYFYKVIGMEIVPDSIKAARENAQLNHIENVEFRVGDISKDLISVFKGNKITGVIADPSRVGLQEKACKVLASKLKAPCHLSLIFCSLKALSRDLPILMQAGFKIDLVQGFDMFPHSMHVETLVCLFKA